MEFIIRHSSVSLEDLKKRSGRSWFARPTFRILGVAESTAEKYNILHICGEPEYEFKTHVDWFKDYPADLINWSVKDNHFTLEEGRELYSSAILGRNEQQRKCAEGTEGSNRGRGKIGA